MELTFEEILALHGVCGEKAIKDCLNESDYINLGEKVTLEDIPKVKNIISQLRKKETMDFLAHYRKVLQKIALLAGVQGARNISGDLMRLLVDWEMNKQNIFSYFTVENKDEISNILVTHFGLETVSGAVDEYTLELKANDAAQNSLALQLRKELVFLLLKFNCGDMNFDLVNID